MKNVIYSILLTILSLTIISCKDDHARRDMVQFDRAFIPVYYNVYMGDLVTAEKAMHLLRHKWQHYQSATFHFRELESEDWKETIRMIGAWLDDTDCALEEKDAFRALVQLDHARYELVDLRIRSNMDDYYLDYLWDFEASMNAAIDVATDPMIDLLEFNEFEKLSEEVNLAWLNLLRSSSDKGLFKHTSDQLRSVKYRKDVLGLAVASLLEAVETADRCQFADAALNIEPAYLNYLVMYGDFEATETFYALKK